MLGHHTPESDALSQHGPGHEEGARLDAVWDDDVLRAVQFFHPFDDNAVGASAFDLGPHLDEEVGEVLHLRLGGGTFDDGGAFGQHGGHHDIVRAEHGGAVLAHEIHLAAFKAFLGIHKDVSAFHLDLCAEGFEALEVEVHRAVADDAATGQRDGALFQAARERTEDADGGAHLAHEIIGRDGFDLLRLDHDDAAGALDLGAELSEDADHVVGVAEVGHTADGAGVLGEEGGGENGQR